MKKIIIAILAVLFIVVSLTGCTNKVDSNVSNDRFHVISREWHNGAIWAIIQDTKTDQLYLQVGSNRPERIDE